MNLAERYQRIQFRELIRQHLIVGRVIQSQADLRKALIGSYHCDSVTMTQLGKNTLSIQIKTNGSAFIYRALEKERKYVVEFKEVRKYAVS